jgi:predicted MFS family arabinose efflux permease
VNLPFGLLTLLLAVLLVPRTPRRTTRADIDYRGILLLGLTVLCVLFPVVLSESDGLRRFWWLFVVAVPLGWLFLRWERRRRQTGQTPLVDTRLFTATRGYPSGAALAAVYFCGFAGIWLVFAVYFQSDLGLSPLESGLAVTPFSLGSAVSAWLAGRLVARYGSRVTITGLVLIATGLTTVAVLGFTVDREHLVWAIALPLLVAGIGGGAVISPNTTLTLACVPTNMSGVASGVLQTGQRIGSAVGTALLAAVFHAVASASAPATGFAVTMIAAVALILVALALAIAERRGHIGNHGNTELENFSSTSMTSGH